MPSDGIRLEGQAQGPSFVLRMGLDSTHYSGHRFRSGAATTAARWGIGDAATIKILGIYQLYVKMPRQQLAGNWGRVPSDIGHSIE